MNTAYADLFMTRVRSGVESTRTVSALTHRSLKGLLRAPWNRLAQDVRGAATRLIHSDYHRETSQVSIPRPAGGGGAR